MKGLIKLAEECGELVQITMKKIMFVDTDEHPDGKGSLKERLEDEIADVEAIIHYVVIEQKLNRKRIHKRRMTKLDKFIKWF